MAWARSASGASCPGMTTPQTWTSRGTVGGRVFCETLVRYIRAVMAACSMRNDRNVSRASCKGRQHPGLQAEALR